MKYFKLFGGGGHKLESCSLGEQRNLLPGNQIQLIFGNLK